MKYTTAITRWLAVACAISSVKAFTFPAPTSSRRAQSGASAFLASTAEAVTSGLIGTPETSFDDGTSPFEITTPIYYVNDKPHIGHAYTSTACDVIARFMRLSGREVFFLSGTDEHGQKVEQSAEKKGIEPQAFVDEVSQSFRDLLDILNISNDKFIRTTSEEHKKSVQVRIRFIFAVLS
jgi:methionyl-tRNA synthetase